MIPRFTVVVNDHESGEVDTYECEKYIVAYLQSAQGPEDDGAEYRSTMESGGHNVLELVGHLRHIALLGDKQLEHLTREGG